MKLSFLPLGLLISVAPTALMAQPALPSRAADAVEEDPDIIVTAAARQRGAVVGDVKPELQLAPADIRALGVSSISDILTELAPQLTSGRGGQPVTLLNGKRISGFSEIRDIPAEAIARLDILPEEVALKYGYTADQKVLNIVLRQRFRAYTGELNAGAATEGGALNGQAEASYLRIRMNARLNVDLKYGESAALFENERGVIPTPNAANTDMTPFRTLTPESKDFSANAVYNNTVFNDVSMTLNGRLEIKNSDGENGLPIIAPIPPATLSSAVTTFGPLAQDNRSTAGHLGLALNADLSKKWHWSFTGNYDVADAHSLNQTGVYASPLAPYPVSLSHSLNNTLAADFLVYGTPFKMPAGDVSTSFKVAVTNAVFDSDARRFNALTNALIPQSGHIMQNIALGQFNLDVPIAGGRDHVLKALGDLTLNANVGAQHYSSFGTLMTFGYGLNWTPVSPLTLIASMTNDHAAPTVNQLTNPQVVTPGQIVLNPLTGQSVIVTQLTGGNANLLASDRHVMKLEANYKPFAKTDLTFNLTYTRSNTKNPISAPTLAQAFVGPDYVNNNILNLTPTNFAREESEQIRWGVNFSKPIKSKRKPPPGGYAALFGNRGPGGADRRPDGDRPAGDRGNGGGGRGQGAGGPGGFGAGRFNIALYHTIMLHDTVLLNQSGPLLNLLNGSETGTSGGQPRHQVSLQTGLSKDGFGARLTGNWQSATDVLGPTSASTLHFGPLATASLRLFVNLGQQPKLVTKYHWLRSTRLSFSINNIFDTRQNVRDGTGLTPFSYQPAYVDATGRTFKISIRKLLF